jgi:hypothetical protein
MDPWSGAELVATATSEVNPEMEWDQGGVSISTKTELVIGTPHGKALVKAEVSVPASDEDVLDTQEGLDRRLETHARRVAGEAVRALARRTTPPPRSSPARPSRPRMGWRSAWRGTRTGSRGARERSRTPPGSPA